MTEQTVVAPGSLAELLSAVEANAAARELAAERPHDVVDLLRETGFLTLRVPREHGGADASLREVFTALIDVARADSSIAQALRAHFAYIEGLRCAPVRRA